MGDTRNSYKMLVERPKWNKLLEMPGYKWEDNIRMALREIG
jgi:hypothetical protein